MKSRSDDKKGNSTPLVRGNVVHIDFGKCPSRTLDGYDEKLGSRPAVVVQNNGGNRGPLTIVCLMTDASAYKGYKQQVEVSVGDGAPSKDSIVECGHIYTISKQLRVKFVYPKPLSEDAMDRVDAALRASLAI